MDDLSDLKKALPSGNRNLPTQNFYKPKGRGRGQFSHSNHANATVCNNTVPSVGEPVSDSLKTGNHEALSNHGNTNSNSRPDQRRRPPRNQSAAWFKGGNDRSVQGRSPDKPYNPKLNQGQHKQQFTFTPGKSAQHQAMDNKNRNNNHNINQPRIRNTVEFEPCHEPSDMRILPAPFGLERYHREITARDVIIVSDLFCSPSDLTIYKNLLEEVESNNHHEWLLWHCDSHVIADDKKRKLKSSPTFEMVIGKLKEYFGMEVAATRFNWFRDTKDWKPYHHDAAALKPEKAAVQNFTAAVSFGVEREASFKHATTGTTVNVPLPNGTVYTFCNDVNVIWRHGIPQLPPNRQTDEGRISIVAWGWVDGVEKVSEDSGSLLVK